MLNARPEHVDFYICEKFGQVPTGAPGPGPSRLQLWESLLSALTGRLAE
jgi:hypothetical protein